ncbi:Uncharacterized protein At4g02000 [Linum perenne]
MRVVWLINGAFRSCWVNCSLRRRSIVRWTHFGWKSGSDDRRPLLHILRLWPLSCLSVRPPGSTILVFETCSFGGNIANRGSWIRLLTEIFYFISLLLSLFLWLLTEIYYFISILLSLFLLILRFCFSLLIKYRRHSLFPFHIAFFSLQTLPLHISLLFCRIATMTSSGGPAWSLQFNEADLKDARERSELSLLARIFWHESRDLRYVENSFLSVWKCDRVRIFNVGYGLYQFIFPSVSKRNFVLAKQPWYYQKAIIHFTDDMNPSKELFDALRVMPLWVKIIGLPLAYRTVAVGRKILEPMGEVVRMGCFDARKPEGCYVKGRVRLDLFNSFLGTAPVKGEDGSSFQVFFQYEGVTCICYLCGYLGHVMGDCYHEDLTFDPLIRDSWICGVADPDEVETEGPCFRRLVSVRPQARRGRGGLPPSVAAGLSSSLHLQWAQTRQNGGQARVGGRDIEGPRPALSLEGPSFVPQALNYEAGKGARLGLEARPNYSKKSAGSAGPSDIKKDPCPRPVAADSPLVGLGLSEVAQREVPFLAPDLEAPIGPVAKSPAGPVATPPPGPVAATPARPRPLVDAPISGSAKRKLEADFEEDFSNIYSDIPALGVKQFADGSTPS